MHDLGLMAVKAAALRKVAVGHPLEGGTFGTPPPLELSEGWGGRAGDPGLGVPKGGLPSGPVSAAERGLLDGPAAAAASRSAGSGGGHYAPPPRPTSGAFARLLKTRGGKAGLGLGALGLLGGAGYGLFGGSSSQPAPAPEPAPAAETGSVLAGTVAKQPPQPPSAGTPRDNVRSFTRGGVKAALGNWWSKMQNRYGLHRGQSS